MDDKHLSKLVKFCIVLSLFCVFLVIVDVSTTVVLHNREANNSNKIDKNTEKIRENSIIIVEAEYRTCERVNTLRHSVNTAHWIQWLQLQQSIERSKKLAEKEPETKSIRLKGNEESGSLAEKITWTPLTDCNKAVLTPKVYVPPRPRHFSENNLKKAPADAVA